MREIGEASPKSLVFSPLSKPSSLHSKFYSEILKFLCPYVPSPLSRFPSSSSPYLFPPTQSNPKSTIWRQWLPSPQHASRVAMSGRSHVPTPSPSSPPYLPSTPRTSPATESAPLLTRRSRPSGPRGRDPWLPPSVSTPSCWCMCSSSAH